MWFEQAVVYQIYPLGFCGAPGQNGGEQSHSITKIKDWVPHILATGANCVLLNPVFQSDRHGYDTRDYFTVDCRLGTNQDLADVCDALHAAGIRVVLDGVFNHVGRGFWAFQDVQKNRWESPYKDWFYLNFDGNTEYNDGFWYEGWEGHNELVKLNLRNPAVTEHLMQAVREWAAQYRIDGLRLDVAYCLDPDFLRTLRRFANEQGDFWLLGETLHGDYNRWANEEMCHSVTNYECYKGLYSSFNSMNLFEIAHSLNRQFGPEPWTLYKGKHLLSFADNHDVGRIATVLQNPAHLPLVYGLLFAMPGIPAIYYGSEWGARGAKQPGSDDALRPCFAQPQQNELTQFIAACAKAHIQSEALCYGNYRNLQITNRQLVFERCAQGERVIVAVNAEDKPFAASFDARAGRGVDLLSGTEHDFAQNELPPYSIAYWKITD